MSRDKISARLHRQPPRALPELHRGRSDSCTGRARVRTTVPARARRGRLCQVVVSGPNVSKMKSKSDFLAEEIAHIDIKQHNVLPLVEAMSKMAFSARELGRAAQIYDAMLRDRDCTIIRCLACSLFSAGLKNVVVDLVRHNMVDAIVSTGAIIVDQDFFEGLGFKHYRGEIAADDDQLRRLAIDRIYDTYIDEDQLRICDSTCAELADRLE